jgi:transcriptional regulator with XRE-family HTH domain
MKKDFNVKVGSIIKEYRQVRRMTQLQLAQRVGIAKSTLACYETGARGIDLDTFFDICYVLGIDPSDVQRQVS